MDDGRALTIELSAERVDLLPQRAAWWPARRTLILADLHLGKAHAFRRLGVPIPRGMLEHDLARLDECLHATGAERLIVAGDLIHSGLGLTGPLVDAVARWRRDHPAELVVVPGNHDARLAQVGGDWGIRVEQPGWRDGPFAFTHEPPDAPPPDAPFTWCGHIHPVARVPCSGGRVRCPCFWVGERVGVLPAFSVFSRGKSWDSPGRVFPIVPAVEGGERVVEARAG